MIKLCEVLSTAWGWFTAVFMFLVDFFYGYGLALNLILILILLDLGWGIAVAVKLKEYTLSESARNTVTKILSYYSSILIVIMIEKLLGTESNIGVSLITTVIALTELWSISGNMLIINPNIPVLRLLRIHLVGEISRKLNVSENRVRKAMNKGEKLTDSVIVKTRVKMKRDK